MTAHGFIQDVIALAPICDTPGSYRVAQPAPMRLAQRYISAARSMT